MGRRGIVFLHGRTSASMPNGSSSSDSLEPPFDGACVATQTRISSSLHANVGAWGSRYRIARPRWLWTAILHGSCSSSIVRRSRIFKTIFEMQTLESRVALLSSGMDLIPVVTGRVVVALSGEFQVVTAT
jgi:hypothetical protein